MFMGYIIQRIHEVSKRIDMKNDSLFTGWGLEKRDDSPQGVSMNANGDANIIKTIGISHQRTRTPGEILTETELSILRSGIGKLTRIAKMERPDLMYDVFEAAHFAQKKEVVRADSKKSPQKEEDNKEKLEKEREEDFCHIPGFF